MARFEGRTQAYDPTGFGHDGTSSFDSLDKAIAWCEAKRNSIQRMERLPEMENARMPYYAKTDFAICALCGTYSGNINILSVTVKEDW